MGIPDRIKENLAWALVSAVGALFVFYVNNTYMTREAYAAEATEISAKLDNILTQIKLESERDKENLQIDGLQDALADAEDEISLLTIYMEEAPDSSLNNARKRRIAELQVEKARLERELAQVLRN